MIKVGTMARSEISAEQGLMLLPGFPVALVVIGTNIITVAATSFFSFRPPMLMIGIVPSRYSYQLIKEIHDFSFNLPGQDLLSEVKYCGSRSGRDHDKFNETKLTPEKSSKIKSFLIAEALVSLECKVIKSFKLENTTHVWFIGEIVSAHVKEDYDRSKSVLYWPKEFRTVGNIIK